MNHINAHYWCHRQNNHSLFFLYLTSEKIQWTAERRRKWSFPSKVKKLSIHSRRNLCRLSKNNRFGWPLPRISIPFSPPCVDITMDRATILTRLDTEIITVVSRSMSIDTYCTLSWSCAFTSLTFTLTNADTRVAISRKLFSLFQPRDTRPHTYP